jgi:hypothetical protein
VHLRARSRSAAAVAEALLVELPLAVTAIWFVVTPARATLTGRPAP